MSKCKTPDCKKEAVPGEVYCCACRDKKDRGFRKLCKFIGLSIVGALAVTWAYITKGDSTSA